MHVCKRVHSSRMNKTENTSVNDLFTKLEAATKAELHFNQQSLFAPAVYNQIFEETLTEIFQIQKRIVRILFRTGEIGEILSHIEAGTFPRFIIQAVFNRI